MATFSAYRLLLTVVTTAVLLVTSIASPVSAQSAEDEPDPEPRVREIMFPVVGPNNYSDTWGACRGYRCSRSHKGADVFGAKLAPLVAATDGVIISVRRTSLTSAGNKVVLRDADGWTYHYFHLNNDSPGTDDAANPQAWIIPSRYRVGDSVGAGEVIGYLGDSGNAETTPNHLHFEIHPPGEGAINPTPSLDAAVAAGRVVPVATLASQPEGRAAHAPLIGAWYRALLKREPTEAESFAWSDRFAIGLANRDDLIADLTMAPQRHRPAGSVMRSFYVVHGRRPAIGELRAAEEQLRSGVDVVGLNQSLITGSEFTNRHGSMSDDEFISVIYRNARGRAPSSSVRQYWIDQLGGGRPRAEMSAYFADSYGLKNTTWHELEVQQAFRAALDRLPSDAEFTRWVDHLDDGGLIVDIVDGIKD